jgi:hypothetical protein
MKLNTCRLGVYILVSKCSGDYTPRRFTVHNWEKMMVIARLIPTRDSVSWNGSLSGEMEQVRLLECRTKRGASMSL